MFIKRAHSLAVATALCGSLVFLPIARHKDADVLSDQDLKTMLDGLGYSPNHLSNGYLIAISRDGWTYNMQVLLSPDASKVGFNANLGAVDDPSTVTADQWRTLLEKNEDVDPSNFYFDKDQKKLYLHRAIDNRDLTPAILRQQIDNFCSNIHDTATDWNFVK